MSFQVVTMTLLRGFGNTCLVFAVTLLCAAPLGLLIAFGSMSRFRVIRLPVRTFIWIIRGTPLLLQLMIVFYGPSLLLNWTGLPRFWAAGIAFIINYAAYFSEIYRSGIESVPHGQNEAGMALGMTRSQIFFKVILLQVLKRIVPPMSNEIITLVKDTALVRIIALREIIMEAYTFTSNGLIWPLFYSGVFYLAFNGLLTLLLGRLERKLDYFKV